MKTKKENYLPPIIKCMEFEVENGFAWTIGDKYIGEDEGDDVWN